jgi:hypothetical protein
MNFKTRLTLFFALFSVVLCNNLMAKPKFEKAAFYKAMASEDLALVDAQLEILKNEGFPEKEAYEGALLMRKAGLTGGPKEKLHLFKSGNKSFEKAISKDENNFEYRFLRLIIQENAPRILGYHDDIEKDSKYIRDNFKGQPAFIKNEVINYSKSSKALKPHDFQ